MTRYRMTVSNTVVVRNPGYVLAYGSSPDDALAYVESLGYIVTDYPVVFG